MKSSPSASLLCTEHNLLSLLILSLAMGEDHHWSSWFASYGSVWGYLIGGGKGSKSIESTVNMKVNTSLACSILSFLDFWVWQTSYNKFWRWNFLTFLVIFQTKLSFLLSLKAVIFDHSNNFQYFCQVFSLEYLKLVYVNVHFHHIAWELCKMSASLFLGGNCHCQYMMTIVWTNTIVARLSNSGKHKTSWYIKNHWVSFKSFFSSSVISRD